MKKRFNSKILLFGEYSVIKYSHALAIPYPLFDGGLEFQKSGTVTMVDNELKEYATYLQRLEEKNQLFSNLDVGSFQFDVSGGLYFDSTIPQGFGVGSSGALCAAIYDRYVTNKSENLNQLKKQFAQLESHFHGASSGFDPLVSYTNTPILIGDEQQLSSVDIPSYSDNSSAIFLLNTGRARRTEPLVNLFLEKCTQDEFLVSCYDQLIPITNSCIDFFLKNDQASLFESFKALSCFQYEHLRPMIPKLYHEIWLEGLKSGDFCLKICGAGGGGFLLGISNNIKRTRKKLSNSELKIVYGN